MLILKCNNAEEKLNSILLWDYSWLQQLMIIINKYVDPKIYYFHEDYFSVNFYLLKYIKFFSIFWYEINIRYLLFKVNLLRYTWTCSITFFHLSENLIIVSFQNWDLFAKYSSRFLFHLRIGTIYQRIF